MPRSPGWADASEIIVTHRRESTVERLDKELSKITDTPVTYKSLEFGQKFVKTTSGRNISLSPETVLVTLRHNPCAPKPGGGESGEDWYEEGALRTILEEWGG